MDELLNTIANLSPTIGTALGGPVGAAVGLGVKTLVNAFTGGQTAPEQIKSYFQLNPDKLLELEKYAQDQQTEQLKALLADTQSARKQTTDLATAGSKIAWAPAILSTIVLVGYFAMFYKLFVIQADFPTGIATQMNIMFGCLQMAVGQVVNYWLGSSRGSDDKSSMFNRLLAK